MRPSLKLLLLYCLTLASCATNDKKQDSKTGIQHSSSPTLQTSDKTQEPLDTKRLKVNSDTLTIDTKAAVFFQPDSLQIEKRMKEIGEENFRAGADDYIYYINTSAEYLEKRGLTVLDAKKKVFKVRSC